MGQVIVYLTERDVGMCVDLAKTRWLIKADSEDRSNYATGRASGVLEHDLIAGIRSNCAEYAVALFTNQSWVVPVYENEYHPDRKSLPDVGLDGEVRTIRTQTGIPFWKKDEGKMIYGARVLDDKYFSEVELFQPFRADDFMIDEYLDPAIDGWRVPIEQLSPTQ